MKIRHLYLLCLIAISATLSANGKTVIPITTDDISLIYKVDDKNGRLYQSYLGQKLSFDSDIVQLPLGNEAYRHMVWKIISSRLFVFCIMTVTRHCS